MKGTNESDERNEHSKLSSKKAAKNMKNNSSVVDQSNIESNTLAPSLEQDSLAIG